MTLLIAIYANIAHAVAPPSNSNKIYFTENSGQITDQHLNPRPDIHFRLTAASGLNMFIGPHGMHYQWSAPGGIPGKPASMYRMDITLLGARSNPQLITEEPVPYFETHYNARTGPEGVRARGFRKITYREIYPSIDLVFYINRQGQTEYDFIVRPGGNVSDIRMRYGGASSLKLLEDGSLKATTPLGSVTARAPYSFQEDGRKVDSRFVLDAQHILRFETGSYEGVLTIDPVLAWGTYFGGMDSENGNNVVIDEQGDIYMTGSTNSSSNIATTGSHQQNNAGQTDVFLVKFGRDGQRLWATYYGGTRDEEGVGLCLDASGSSVYVAGHTTSSTELATAGTHQTAKASTSNNGIDLFLAKFDAATGSRIWGSYFGGTGNEVRTGISLANDADGNIYLAGSTASNNGIAVNSPHQAARAGGNDAFVAKFTSSGAVAWSTYYGGAASESVAGIEVSGSGFIYLGGHTSSDTGIATSGTHQPARAGASQDAFLVKFNNQGNRIWGTYAGGSGNEAPANLTLDEAGNPYLSGSTLSDTGISTPGVHQAAISDLTFGDGFCIKFSADGQRIWGTYYGGTSEDGITAVTAHKGHLYITGFTRSETHIATPDGFDPDKNSSEGGGYGGFFAKLTTDGQRLWGSYFAGVLSTFPFAIAADAMDNFYFCGTTQDGTMIATDNGFQKSHGGGVTDAFLIRFNDCLPAAAPTLISGPDDVCTGSGQLYTTSALGSIITGYTWIIPPGWSGSSQTDSIYIIPGGDTGSIGLVAHNFCGSVSDTFYFRPNLMAGPELRPVPLNACEGDTILIEAVTDPAVTLSWLQDAQIIPGIIQPALSVYGSGTYRIIADNGSCRDTSDGVSIVFHALPEPEILNQEGALSTTLPYAGYQWYFNGERIAGAVSAEYNARFEGSYTVEVTDQNGCTAPADSVYIGGTSVSASLINAEIRIHPNPATDRIRVDAGQPLTTRIRTPEGRTVITQAIAPYQSPAHIEISSLPEGIYLIELLNSSGQTIHFEKLLKL